MDKRQLFFIVQWRKTSFYAWSMHDFCLINQRNYRHLPILILSIAVFICGAAQADFPDSADIELINTGIALTFNEKYEEARSLLQGLREKYPDHPAGPFFIAATYQAEMKDHEDFNRESEFYDNIKITIELGDLLRNHDKADDWAYYFMGAGNLYRALYDSRKGARFSPAHKSIRGKNLLEKCLDLDPSNLDALAALGSYRYWGAVKAGGLGWLPFIGGNREQGIADLELASGKALFSGDLAASALIHVYIHEKRFAQADSLAGHLAAKYPDGKAFLWARAFAAFEGEHYQHALELFNALLTRINPEASPNNYNRYEIGYYRMLCYFSLQNYDLAWQEISYCQNLELSKEVRTRLKRQINELKKHHKKLEKILPAGK